MTDTRIDRLQYDYEALKRLVALSPFVHIVQTTGSPPSIYELRLTCRGVEAVDSAGNPKYREEHILEIQLPERYPLVKPDLKWKTPIFHPNIRGSSVCIGNTWTSGGRFLDDLVLFLMQMVRYEGLGLTYNTRETPFNRNAVAWAEAHSHLLPVDTRPMLRSISVRSSTGVGEKQQGTRHVTIRRE